MPPRILLPALLAVVWATACSSDSGPGAADPGPLASVEVSSERTLPCLEKPAHVVRTAFDVPHIYAESPEDIACVQGFVTATDRYFMIELGRRLGWGRLSEVLGSLGHEIDMGNVGLGMRKASQSIWDGLPPEWKARFEAYAQGVNAYVAAAKAGELPPPAELEAAYLFLGARDVTELMREWEASDPVGLATVVIYQGSFTTNDVELTEGLQQLESWGLELPESELRRAGARLDIVERIQPVHPWSSVGTGGRRLDPQGGATQALRPPGALRLRPPITDRPKLHLGTPVESDLLARTTRFITTQAQRMLRDPEKSKGSNNWAIAPENTAGGHALLANDGHLALTVPATFYAMHTDDALLAGGDTHAIGFSLPGLPAVAPGTNGKVAWAQTIHNGDPVDWYREEIILDGARPVASRFRGAEEPLVEFVERYEISGALGGTAGSVEVPRWETFDGRMIVSFEGRPVASRDAEPGTVWSGDTWLVPMDVNGDGVVGAISLIYSGHFERHIAPGIDGFLRAADVDGLAERHASIAAYGGNIVAADTGGNIYYSGYQATACRGYLPRDADGVPEPGAHPQLLLDGTQHPSFEVSFAGGMVDPAPGDERRCMISFEDYPHVVNPDEGFIVNANNAPHDGAFDGDLWNDSTPYMGGPWYAGYRSERIKDLIVEGGDTHTLASQSAIQNDQQATMAPDYVPALLDAIQAGAEALAAREGGEVEPHIERLANLFEDRRGAFEAVAGRMTAWRDRGYDSASGVETFYAQPTADERADAVATMIFHAWLGRLLGLVVLDEQLPLLGRPSRRRARSLYFFVHGRGPDNPLGLASWNAETEESVFFDVVGTEAFERSEETMLLALGDTLDFLASPPAEVGLDAGGGFGTPDMDAWLWGLKHTVRFESIVAGYLSGDDVFGALLAGFGITHDVLAVDDPAPAEGDPRAGLRGYPRPGGQRSVDASNDFMVHDFSYTHGPVFRTVFEMDPAGVRGVTVLPGGQSGLPSSPHFADQAALWLGNEVWEIPFAVEDVVSAALGRELMRPTP